MSTKKSIDPVKRDKGATKLNALNRQIMKQVCIFCTLLLLFISNVNAQSPGPFYRQFNFNPYLFNPAYVGINNQIEASLAYRQQWANFKDAPVTAGVSLQLPTSERVSIGFNVFTDRQVLLQNSNFMATFGYVVPVAKNQSLRFGLSGGVGLNKLDLSAEEMNTNDPLIVSSVGTNYYIDGNFGVVYTYDGLRLGFALTDIFKSNSFSAENFNKFKMSNLRNRLFSASYRFNVGAMQNVALEPYVLYRQTTDSKQDYWEAATVAYFKQNIWTGISYNQNKGLGLLMGMNVKDKFRFSYSYEFAPFNSDIAAGGAHELHLGVRLASKKVQAYTKKNQQQQNVRDLANEQYRAAEKGKTAVVLEEPTPAEDQEIHQQRLIEGDHKPKPNIAAVETVKKETVTPANTTVVAKPAPAKTNAKSTTAKPRENFTMSRGRHYVVVGVFKVMAGSMRFVKEIKAKGYSANVALNPKNNLYYVYISSSFKIEDAKKSRNKYKLKNLFKEAWLFSMD